MVLEELVKAPCFAAPGNKELLELYRSFLQDQPSSAPWTGFASKISPVKHASLVIAISKQYDGESHHACTQRHQDDSISSRIKAFMFAICSGFADSESGITSSIQFLDEVDAKLSTDKEAVLIIRSSSTSYAVHAHTHRKTTKVLYSCRDIFGR